MADWDRAELRRLYEGDFAAYREEDWAKAWRKKYMEHVRSVQEASWEEWRTRSFQERLWDRDAVAKIGSGNSVTVHSAYSDEELAKILFEARGTMEGMPVEERGARIQALYDQVMEIVLRKHSTRRPRARLMRLLAAIFPDDMTSIADTREKSGETDMPVLPLEARRRPPSYRRLRDYEIASVPANVFATFEDGDPAEAALV